MKHPNRSTRSGLRVFVSAAAASVLVLAGVVSASAAEASADSETTHGRSQQDAISPEPSGETFAQTIPAQDAQEDSAQSSSESPVVANSEAGSGSGSESPLNADPSTTAQSSTSLSSTVASAQTSQNLVRNGDFANFTGALPDGWGRWNAAGTGSVAKAEGPEGSTSLSITTDTPSSRLALTQDVTLTETRYYRLEFDLRTSNLTAGTSYSKVGIRVDGLGAGASPAVWAVGSFGTNDWQTITYNLTFAAPTTSARIHLMTDYGQGVAQFANVRLIPTDAPKSLTGTVTAAGDTVMSWTPELLGDAQVSRVELHRFGADEDAVPSDVSLLRSVSAATLRVTDHAWIQGVQYQYVAVGLDASGTAVWQSDPLLFTNNNADKNVTSYISGSLNGEGTHVSWRTPSSYSGAVSVVADGTTVTTGVSHIGGLDLDHAVTNLQLLDGSGQVLATATAVSQQHPRLGLTPEKVEHARAVIAAHETPAEAWATVKARVDAGVDAFPSSAERYAREAAFVYQITEDSKYAQLAYESSLIAIQKVTIPTPQELEAANTLSSLVLAYDWSYNAWSPEQRQVLENYFDLSVLHLQTGSHPNIILADKASNWVAVVRGAELAYLLAVRGEESWTDARLGQLIDELDQHQMAAYSETGMFQEGLDYLDYTQMITTQGVQGSFDQGIDALKESWERPDVANLILHTVALTDSKKRLQWGVGTVGDSIGFPMYLQRVRDGEMAAYLELWEKRAGHLAADAASGKWYSYGYVTDLFLYWPLEQPTLEQPLVPEAILDDYAGAYFFRNVVSDANDVLAGFNSRNSNHLGWSGFDSFAISLISHNTVWASMPGKSQTNAAAYSRLMVDDKASQQVGNGQTLASHAYEGQGGGYVQFSAGQNIGLASAQRELVVDMGSGLKLPATLEPDGNDAALSGSPDSVIVMSDVLSDLSAHKYSWQLVPEAGVEVEIKDQENGVQQFVFRNGDAWLSGWVVDSPEAQLSWDGSTFRITLDLVTDATLNQVLSVGTGELPILKRDGSLVTVGGETYDLANLAAYTPTVTEDPGTDPEEPGTDPEQPGTDPEDGTAVPGDGDTKPGTDKEPGKEGKLPKTGLSIGILLLAAVAIGGSGLALRRRNARV